MTNARSRWFFCAAFCFLTGTVGSASCQEPRPNIVWIIVEDMSANFGCYGEDAIQTPNVDGLAFEGIRFSNAIVTAPVCSASRSALITGMYQTSIGAHHHCSGRGTEKIHLPDNVRLVPQIFKDAGYLTLNLASTEFTPFGRGDADVRQAKSDYNFQWDQTVYGKRHWSRREPGQPFFCQVQMSGGKLRESRVFPNPRWATRVRQNLGTTTPASAVRLPPYLPVHPVLTGDWAAYLDTCRYTDWEVGRVISSLRVTGDLDNTVIFFMTDHGISHVRNKQFCYEGGVHIPLIIRGPGIEAGQVRNDVVEHIDVAATSLGLAGIEVPDWMQGRDILAEDYAPRSFGFSARDRCDETVDRIRCVRTERFKYICNFYPQRPYLSPNNYKDKKPIVMTLRELHASGDLDANQSRIMASSRPEEELYDLANDPFELHNLAGDPRQQETLQELRQALSNWIRETGDRAESPEPLTMYDSDMSAYLSRPYLTELDTATIQQNIKQMKAWAAAGK